MESNAEVTVIVAGNAEDRINHLGFHKELEIIISFFKTTVPTLQTIEVYPFFSHPTEPNIMIRAYRDSMETEQEEEATERMRMGWLKQQFPPDVAKWFLFDMDHQTLENC